MASPSSSGDGKTNPFGNGGGNTGASSGSVKKGPMGDQMSGTGKATMDAFGPAKPQQRGTAPVQEYSEAGGGNVTGAKSHELVGNEAKPGKTPDVQATGSSGTGPGRLPVKFTGTK
jgi:hypothetical protein